VSATAYVGIGSNLCDPAAQVAAAIRALRALGHVRASSLYRTEPLGDPDQPWYVNAVCELRTELGPGALFERLQELERRAGRPARRARGAARVLDLDLLLYDDLSLDSGSLEIPHPRYHERRFVLDPLVELAPGVCDPRTGLTALELRDALDDPLRVERLRGRLLDPDSAAVIGLNPLREVSQR
jgi:2-amino-4-hydroxy-6-hydroxymethyldihydropteridine diphosphokinase